jgi:hypothetical protein
VTWEIAHPLPFIPQPFFDEILSSWLRRIAFEYGMELSEFTQYLELHASTAGSLDFDSNSGDRVRIANALRSAPDTIQAMTHRHLKGPAKNLLSKSFPIQICRPCHAFHLAQTNQKVHIKGWVEYWTVECMKCRRAFSSLGPVKLKAGNPRHEDLEWYNATFSLAKIGAKKLLEFAMQPYRTEVSPAACLELLSMRTGPRRHPGTWNNQHLPVIIKSENHCIAEILVPGLSEWLDRVSLIPKPWKQDRPIKDVTARTVLFAGLAILIADLPAGWAKIRERIDHVKTDEVDRWLSKQPSYLADLLSRPDRKSAKTSHVSQLQQL